MSALAESPAGAELRQLTALVTAALAHLAEGRAIDVKALESRTQRLCRSLATLPPEESRGYLPILDDLLAGLDRLGQAFALRLEGALHAQGGGA